MSQSPSTQGEIYDLEQVSLSEPVSSSLTQGMGLAGLYLTGWCLLILYLE